MKLDITNELQVFAHTAAGLEKIEEEKLSAGYTIKDWTSYSRHPENKIKYLSIKKAEQVLSEVQTYSDKKYFVDILAVATILSSIDNIDFFNAYANLQTPIFPRGSYVDGNKTETASAKAEAELIIKFNNDFDKGFLLPISIKYTTAEYTGIVNNYSPVSIDNFSGYTDVSLYQLDPDKQEPVISDFSIGNIREIK